MTKHFYIFRHGQTDWNLIDRIQGQTDIPLNEAGTIEARSLGGRLKELNLEIIYTSPLKRAYETAKIANEYLGLEIISSDALKEAYLGDIEGMELKELYKLYGRDFFFKWRSGLKIYETCNYPKAEEKLAIAKRVEEFILNLAKNSKLDRIGISTHGFLIRRLLSTIDENLPPDGKMPNVSIWHLEYSNGKLKFLTVT